MLDTHWAPTPLQPGLWMLKRYPLPQLIIRHQTKGRTVSETRTFYRSHTLHKALMDIVDERRRQESIWGVQNLSPLEWLAILTEEVGETAQAALALQEPALHNPSGEYDLPVEQLEARYRRELTQVAAVACAALECLDRNGGEG